MHWEDRNGGYRVGNKLLTRLLSVFMTVISSLPLLVAPYYIWVMWQLCELDSGLAIQKCFDISNLVFSLYTQRHTCPPTYLFVYFWAGPTYLGQLELYFPSYDINDWGLSLGYTTSAIDFEFFLSGQVVTSWFGRLFIELASALLAVSQTHGQQGLHVTSSV